VNYRWDSTEEIKVNLPPVPATHREGQYSVTLEAVNQFLSLSYHVPLSKSNVAYVPKRSEKFVEDAQKKRGAKIPTNPVKSRG